MSLHAPGYKNRSEVLHGLCSPKMGSKEQDYQLLQCHVRSPSPHCSIIPTKACHHIKWEPHVNNRNWLHDFNFTDSNVVTEDLTLLQRVNSRSRRHTFIQNMALICQNIRRCVSDDSHFHYGSCFFLDHGDCKYRSYIILSCFFLDHGDCIYRSYIILYYIILFYSS
jgi:hypothetical protein